MNTDTIIFILIITIITLHLLLRKQYSKIVLDVAIIVMIISLLLIVLFPHRLARLDYCLGIFWYNKKTTTFNSDCFCCIIYL